MVSLAVELKGGRRRVAGEDEDEDETVKEASRDRGGRDRDDREGRDDCELVGGPTGGVAAIS